MHVQRNNRAEPRSVWRAPEESKSRSVHEVPSSITSYESARGCTMSKKSATFSAPMDWGDKETQAWLIAS